MKGLFGARPEPVHVEPQLHAQPQPDQLAWKRRLERDEAQIAAERERRHAAEVQDRAARFKAALTVLGTARDLLAEREDPETRAARLLVDRAIELLDGEPAQAG